MDRFSLAQQLGEEVGSYVRGQFQQRTFSVSAKEDSSTLTTADLEAESRILRAIRENFPGDGIVGEESEAQEGSSGITWYIDPIDGTANFAAGLPLYGISIAYTDLQGVQGAVIVLPELHASVTAKRGKGTLWNGRPIRVKPFSTVEKSTVLLSSRKDERVYSFMKKHRRIRILGSAVVSCCFVAAGAADAYLAFSHSPWDHAAGMLLVTEAGGAVVALDGSPITHPDVSDVIMASSGVLESLLERVSDLS